MLEQECKSTCLKPWAILHCFGVFRNTRANILLKSGAHGRKTTMRTYKKQQIIYQTHQTNITHYVVQMVIRNAKSYTQVQSLSMNSSSRRNLSYPPMTISHDARVSQRPTTTWKMCKHMYEYKFPVCFPLWFWPILPFRCVFRWSRPPPSVRRRPPPTARRPSAGRPLSARRRPPSIRLGLMGPWNPWTLLAHGPYMGHIRNYIWAPPGKN